MSADTDEPFWFALLLIIPAVVYLSARSRASAICCLASALRSLSRIPEISSSRNAHIAFHISQP